ncbi:PadR family transcriptional regulator [Cryobacterium sp. Y11]|uniref:PadR family transcriptional regulator n=1 Tax=Cryobacterium sp. Y11 TaxID=2045016 RepID=UPI000CE51299|nr:PadR family transcriptional regulator [Cryobacterium sp. Y11]
MQLKPWPAEWMRAALGLSVLRTLAPGPTYGYAIATALETAGFGAIKGGTLYPLLTRFEAAGWIAAEWRPGAGGPGRKYFSLTDAGQQELTDQAAHWQLFSTTVHDHLQKGPAES